MLILLISLLLTGGLFFAFGLAQIILHSEGFEFTENDIRIGASGTATIPLIVGGCIVVLTLMWMANINFRAALHQNHSGTVHIVAGIVAIFSVGLLSKLFLSAIDKQQTSEKFLIWSTPFMIILTLMLTFSSGGAPYLPRMPSAVSGLYITGLFGGVAAFWAAGNFYTYTYLPHHESHDGQADASKMITNGISLGLYGSLVGLFIPFTVIVPMAKDPIVISQVVIVAISLALKIYIIVWGFKFDKLETNIAIRKRLKHLFNAGLVCMSWDMLSVVWV